MSFIIAEILMIFSLAMVVYYLSRKKLLILNRITYTFFGICVIAFTSAVLVIYKKNFNSFDLCLMSVLISLLTGICIIDYKTKEIDKYLLLCIMIMGVVSLIRTDYMVVLDHIIAFSIFGGVLLLISIISKKVGMGDVKLLALVALLLGLKIALSVILYSLILSLLYGIICVVFKKKKMNSEMAFAPFVLIGTLLTIYIYI